MTDAQQRHYPSANADSPHPFPQAAPESAREAGRAVVDAGAGLASTTKDEGQHIVQHAGNEARSLYHQARAELTDQLAVQQKRAAGSLHEFSNEITRMADQGGQSGAAAQVARQAADRAGKAAHWLEQREPGQLMAEVKGYARRNPGMFLMGAAALGVLAGRLTRNLAVGSGEDQESLNSGPEDISSPQSSPQSSPSIPPGTIRADMPSRLEPSLAPGMPGAAVPPEAAMRADAELVAEATRRSGYSQPGTEDLGLNR